MRLSGTSSSVVAFVWMLVVVLAGSSTSVAQTNSPQKKTAGEEFSKASEREYPPEVYDPAWARYREAFASLAAGKRQQALEQLRVLRKKYEGHPAALFAGPVIEQLEARLAGASANKQKAGRAKKTDESGDDKEELAASDTDRLGIEKETAMARAGLVTFQTLHGMALGFEFCSLGECAGARPVIASGMVGTGVGLGASLYATRNGITPGRTLAINVGTQWGFWHAVALNSITRNWANDVSVGIAPLIGGQLAGLGGGIAAAHFLRPQAGDVAMANWFGIWTGLMTGLFQVTAGMEPSGPVLMGSLLVASDIGAISGALLSVKEPISQGRMWVINTGGLLGGMTGAGTSLLLGGDAVDPQLVTGVSMIGIATGLGLGTLLTKGWELGEEPGEGHTLESAVSVRPTLRGRGAIFSFGSEF